MRSIEYLSRDLDCIRCITDHRITTEIGFTIDGRVAIRFTVYPIDDRVYCVSKVVEEMNVTDRLVKVIYESNI